jgi:hypothetical protein
MTKLLLSARTTRRLGLLAAGLILALASSGLAGAQFQGERIPARIPVISYQGVTADPGVVHRTSQPGFFDVRLEAFKEQMRYLREAGYSAITAEEYEKWMHGDDVSLPDKPVLITFDDGTRSAQLATPILRENGLAATMYVVSGFADADFGGPHGEPGWYLSWDELKRMRSTGLWEMQLHAGPKGHMYVRDPADPGCRSFYACRLGEGETAYRARVKSDVAQGLGAMRSAFGLPDGWRGSSFAVPWDGAAEDWLPAYLASQFPVVFVNDYVDGRSNQRFRFEVHNPHDLEQFKASLDSPRFER